MVAPQDIFSIQTEIDFNRVALKVFRFQFENNPVYRSFCDLLLRHPSDVRNYWEIPFMPIQFFKSHKVLVRDKTAEVTFYSSGTTHQGNSKHHVAELSLYEKSFQNGFQQFYGNIQDYVILALLPSYLEQENSSLVYMVDKLIKSTNSPDSGFYLNNLEKLQEKIFQLEKQNQKTLLIGVTYALLDLVEKYNFNLKNTIVMETGGMKGRRKEITREELHKILTDGFGVSSIHSEYGMTELLSQAYSKGDGLFKCSPWMKILTRSVNDPFSILDNDKTGGINIIDLANLYSCSFLATQDLGKVNENGTFEVIGRFDQSDIRGCNLMVL
ncbi:MAG: acyl transferase [Flavobacteriaceae bacterium]|nr:acyl transferase [Flavobacteriaceae bacterium]